MADLDHTSESDQVFLIDLISPEQFGVVAEVAEEPRGRGGRDLDRTGSQGMQGIPPKNLRTGDLCPIVEALGRLFM